MSIYEELKERTSKCLGVANTPKSNERRDALVTWLGDHGTATVSNMPYEHVGAFLAFIKAWEDEDSSSFETGPIRNVTKRELVPGRYGILHVGCPGDGFVPLSMEPGRYGADELRAAAATLTQIADFLDPQETAL